MDEPLKEIHNILDKFETDLANIRAFEKELEDLNPGFEPVSEENWQKKNARMWLHGATEIDECNELVRWLIDSPPLTETAKSGAQSHYDNWRKSLDSDGGWEGSSCYADDPNFNILPPSGNEILVNYIVRLVQQVKKEGRGKKLQWRALKSFLHFLRKRKVDSRFAFIEHIIPEEMDVVHNNRIIKLLRSEDFPIPEKTASEIIINLANRCRHEIRKDAQVTAAESLGLCWLCITASRLRLPIHLEAVRKIKPAAIHLGSEFPMIQVPTWFGNRPINISHRLARFLGVLARIPSQKQRETILQRPFRSLTRMLESALESVAPRPDYGNITYVSFLTQPHIFGDHRPQPIGLSSN